MKWLLTKLKQTSDSGYINRAQHQIHGKHSKQSQRCVSLSAAPGGEGRLGDGPFTPPDQSAVIPLLLRSCSSCFFPGSVTFYFIVKSKAHIAHFTVSDLSVISDTFLDTFSFLGFCDTPLSCSTFSLSRPFTFSAHPLNAGIP